MIFYQVSMRLISIAALLSITTQAFSFDFKNQLTHGHAVIQLGGYWGDEGKQQHISIENLIGDNFTVTNRQSGNVLAGLGYFVDGQDKDLFKMVYGVNAFYLAKTRISGDVVQENLFTNLSYGYNITHYPVYAVAKSIIKTKSPRYAVTVDLGVGPNFMHTSNFREHSLDGVTIPDNIFSGQTTTTFSVMTGLGIKINDVFGNAPLECGYKFFYLGQGGFSANNTQVLNTLNTGNDYANALMCSITL